MSQALRATRIARIIFRHRLDALVDANSVAPEQLPAWLRLWWRASGRFGRTLTAPPARRLREALEELGPVFVKFGQILSTRRDLLPKDYADELALLQDSVAPFPGSEARRIVEASLGRPIASVFAEFEETPLASASVAQVHAARLADDRAEVVVKVIRPSIERVIRADLQLLHTIAGLLERFSVDARRLHLVEIAQDYERTILDELNLRREAANTTKLRRNFAESPLLYVPRVYWDHTRDDVLVLERIRGIPIANVAALRARGTDMRVLAERGVETFFTQVFVHNFFHADMHPGNIFVDVSDPSSPRYIAVDCAIIGSLTADDQAYLARNLLAFFNQDYRQVAKLHLESGWIPEETRIEEFETVIRQVCEPIFAKPLKDISFGHFLVTLFRTARQFNMEVQPQLVLLQKTLLNIEGLGRQLYPDLDLWSTAKPFMEKWMADRVGPAAVLRELGAHAPEIMEQLPRLPELVAHAGQAMRRLEQIVREQRQTTARLDTLIDEQRRRDRRRRLVGVALLAGGVALLWKPVASSLAAGEALPAIVAIVAAVLGSLLIARS
jgi:ubiquinone biosynthesis protein